MGVDIDNPRPAIYSIGWFTIDLMSTLLERANQVILWVKWAKHGSNEYEPEITSKILSFRKITPIEGFIE